MISVVDTLLFSCHSPALTGDLCIGMLKRRKMRLKGLCAAVAAGTLSCGVATADMGPAAGGGALGHSIGQSASKITAAAYLQSRALSPLSALLFRGMNLGLWQEYTAQALLPDFARKLGFGYDVDVSLLAQHESMLLPAYVDERYPVSADTTLSFGLAAFRVPETPLVSDFSSRLLGLSGSGYGFDRSVMASGLSRKFGQGNALDVAAVFAYQRYASQGMGSRVFESGVPTLPGEQSSGAGVRFGFSSELAPGVEFGAAYQSRIDMDAFQNYRGVYAEPGDFDIPASANFGIVVKASQKASLSFDVQRVLYSEVNTFTSNLLPDRFLSLLGDSASPDFSWQDLTVYRVGWDWQSSEDITWNVSYSTSQQPTPTSDSLARALSPQFADRNMSFGFSKRTGRQARLNFAASYAPSEYLLGTPSLSRGSNLDGDQFEFEVIWVWDF